MAKTIKFNLMIDGKPIRNLEGLRDHFNIDDLLEHYESGILQRWLRVRQMENLADKIDKIAASDEIKKAQELIETLWLPIEERKLKETVYHLVARREKERQLQLLVQKLMKEREIIKNYHEEYNKICESLKNEKEDYPFIKSQLNRVANEFYELFKMDYPTLYFQLIETSPLAVFATLANETLRSLFIYHSGINSSITSYVQKNITFQKKDTLEKETVDVSITKKDIEMLLDEYRRTSRIKRVEVHTYSTWTTQMTSIDKIDFKNSSKIIILASNLPETSTGRKLAGEILDKNDPTFSTLTTLITTKSSSEYYLNYVAYNDVETLIKYKKERKKEFEIKKTEGIKEFEIKKTEGINIPSYIMPFSGKTDSYWKDLEPQGKKYLIIRMEPGNFVRNAGKAKEELSADDVNGKFPILDGIDYKSNNADHVLYYMEV